MNPSLRCFPRAPRRPLRDPRNGKFATLAALLADSLALVGKRGIGRGVLTLVEKKGA
jgi:hypothetical protein